MRKRIDLVGQKFGRLTVISLDHIERRSRYWLCVCECGNKKVARECRLISGRIKSCGCRRYINRKANNKIAKNQDITGMIFGRLTVLYSCGVNKGHHRIWLCQCICGKQKKVLGLNLKNGNTSSCGCLAIENTKKRSTTHGMTKTIIHSRWSGMKNRCNNPHDPFWNRYGGRGIKVCDRWQNSFEAFLQDMGSTFDPILQLDRIDNDGDYSPENCHWVTCKENANNKKGHNYHDSPKVTTTSQLPIP